MEIADPKLGDLHHFLGQFGGVVRVNPVRHI
jgi:hypothetical protein